MFQHVLRTRVCKALFAAPPLVAGSLSVCLTNGNTHAHFREDYDMNRLVGHGTFGLVQRCISRSDGSTAAVKVLTKDATSPIDTLQEVGILRTIETQGGHPNIVSYRAHYNEEDFVYIVTEYLRGSTLYNHVIQHRRLEEAKALELLKQLGNAVDFLHHQQIVHGDIKPDNIMIDGDHLKLLDFGSAQYLHHQNENLDSVSGTQAYWPPEMLTSLQSSKGVDVWAMGCILYIMISGQHPFDPTGHTSIEHILERVQRDSVTFEAPIWDTVSTKTKHLIASMLTKDPSQRASIEHVKLQLLV